MKLALKLVSQNTSREQSNWVDEQQVFGRWVIQHYFETKIKMAPKQLTSLTQELREFLTNIKWEIDWVGQFSSFKLYGKCENFWWIFGFELSVTPYPKPRTEIFDVFCETKG